MFRGLTDARLRLLREAPGYRLLFLAALASGLGTWLAFVALVVDVTDRTADARWVSALLVVEFLPVVAVGLLAAPLVDRLPRRTLLVAADLVRAVVFLALPFAPSALALVLFALLAGVARASSVPPSTRASRTSSPTATSRRRTVSCSRPRTRRVRWALSWAARSSRSPDPTPPTS